MGQDHKLYDLAYPAPQIESVPRSGLVLVVAMSGYADAGKAVEMSAKHLTDALEHTPLAVFNTDELIDYRSRRPAVELHDGLITGMEDVDLSIEVLSDLDGQQFLLLSGAEPDLRWQGFSKAVADLMGELDVKQTVCLYSAASTLPHTRPIVITSHGTIKATTPYRFMGHDMPQSLPGSAALSIEVQMLLRDKLAGGLTACVPNYLANGHYPAATEGLLAEVAEVADLSLPLGSLDKEARSVDEAATELVANSPSLSEMVSSLEAAFDADHERMLAEADEAFTRDDGDDGDTDLADDLGQAAEQFLIDRQSRAIDGAHWRGASPNVFAVAIDEKRSSPKMTGSSSQPDSGMRDDKSYPFVDPAQIDAGAIDHHANSSSSPSPDGHSTGNAVAPALKRLAGKVFRTLSSRGRDKNR